MKTVIAIVSVILIIIVTTIIIASTSVNTNVTELTVMRDITDVQLAQPQLTDIVPLLNLNNAKWNGAEVRFLDITDVSYNHTYQAIINPENQWMGNEFDREKKVKDFYAQITQILTNLEKETNGKDNSSIYLPIANELNRLSQSKAEKRILLVYSDLMENTDELSFYNKSKFSLLQSDPDSIQKYFLAQVPLSKLSGITIYLIYQPSDPKADEEYQIVSRFYKTLFESKGATVLITANIN
jgi:hypothetical protein